MGSGQSGPKGPPEDGSSLFYLYCRAERKDLWYPVSVLQSDSQAQGLISAWLNAPLAKGGFGGDGEAEDCPCLQRHGQAWRAGRRQEAARYLRRGDCWPSEGGEIRLLAISEAGRLLGI